MVEDLSTKLLTLANYYWKKDDLYRKICLFNNYDCVIYLKLKCVHFGYSDKTPISTATLRKLSSTSSRLFDVFIEQNISLDLIKLTNPVKTTNFTKSFIFDAP